jgi:hypothetical protein
VLVGLGLSGPSVKAAQAEMTVCAQGSHAESVGQIQRQPVTLLGTLELGLATPRVNLAVKPERPRLVATLATPAGDVERLIGKAKSILDPAGEQACLAEVFEQA